MTRVSQCLISMHSEHPVLPLPHTSSWRGADTVTCHKHCFSWNLGSKMCDILYFENVERQELEENCEEFEGTQKDDWVEEESPQLSNCKHSFSKRGATSDSLPPFCDVGCVAAAGGMYEEWTCSEKEGVPIRKGTMTGTTNGVRKPEVEFFWSQPLTSHYNGRLNPRVEAPVGVLSIKCACFLQYWHKNTSSSWNNAIPLLINCIHVRIISLAATVSSGNFYRLPISASYFLHSPRPSYRLSLKVSFILSLTSPSSSFSLPSLYFSPSYACQFLNISVTFPPRPYILPLSMVCSFCPTASCSWFHQFKSYLHFICLQFVSWLVARFREM
jgi:hypothetical protein